ncbi:MAG: hypothetical protein A2V85_11380 [Chloroflexi bacterium RBG_16_72_14]|nr:MAG: hypothetical protein A2V85_11380 [Chloroflexi bacterium RBG_16_72_14]
MALPVATPVARPVLRPGLARWYRPLIVGLAVGGAIFGVGSVLWGYALGMWPPHDTSAFWLAGRHLIEGTPVYGGGASWYLAFVYAPPDAVLMMLPGLLPYQVFSVALLILQVLALRYITGSWVATAMLGWIPWIHHEFVAGNVDCLMAAAIYASMRNQRGSGVAVAVFAFAKFSPVLVLAHASRRQWIEVGLATVVLLALTLPVLHLWPEWIAKLSVKGEYAGILPLFVRVPTVAVLLLYRRPWTVAAAAALATPIFYTQSIVLLLPAVRLWWDDSGREMLARRGLSPRLS